jgi:hypothetical protein
MTSRRVNPSRSSLFSSGMTPPPRTPRRQTPNLFIELENRAIVHLFSNCHARTASAR